MSVHHVRTVPSAARLPLEAHLAFALARVAVDAAPIDPQAQAVVLDRIVDNAAVAIAALDRRPVAVARAQALGHPRARGATVVGLPVETLVDAEWAAWANGTAVRELDFHDTFLAAEYAHPADAIPALIAVAQQLDRSGNDLIVGVLSAYEIHVALATAIDLHSHKIDHVTHLAAAIAGGLGALLGLAAEVVAQAIGQSVHVNTATRQSRKGEISSWKAFAPAHAAKTAIEAVDRAMRGERSPSPIYEGEDGLIAHLLAGPHAEYDVTLPEPGAPKRAILRTYTKAYSAEYQAQALIDLAFDLRARLDDPAQIARIDLFTSDHTHAVIGSGANDPQKYDPEATRETLDHSAPYIVAVALADGDWDHERSYTRERARRAAREGLWTRILTHEDPAWTARYHDPDPTAKAFGARAEVTLHDGTRIVAERAVADAHPAGAQPFDRAAARAKFTALTANRLVAGEHERFLAAVDAVPEARAGTLRALGLVARPDLVAVDSLPRGLW